MASKTEIIQNCKKILQAYRSGKLGQVKMPEDANPGFSDHEKEARLAYFSIVNLFAYIFIMVSLVDVWR